jgi:beta-glucuronidase
VLNESAAGSPGGIRFFRAMKEYIKSLDPERYVTLADDNLPKLKSAADSAANDADFLMMNEYFGAWHGPREALGPALDKVDRLFPAKMVIISEMGYPGIFAKTPAEADPMRVSILREQLPLLAQREWIGGAILWCYQDYKSRRTQPLPAAGVNLAADVPAREKPTPFRLVVKLLRPDGTLAMERSLSAQ